MLDLWEELREEKCKDMKFEEMPTKGLQLEDCHDCADEQVVTGPLRSHYDKKKCLNYKTQSDGHLIAVSCHGRQNQEFYFDGRALKSKYDDKCLDYYEAGGPAFMPLATIYRLESLSLCKVGPRFCRDSAVETRYECHGGAHQQWEFDGRVFTNTIGDKKRCLDYNYGTGKVWVHHTCHQAPRIWKCVCMQVVILVVHPFGRAYILCFSS